MLSMKVNNDLQKERNNCNFDVEELTNFLDGGAHLTASRRKIENRVLSEKSLKDEIPEEYLSHKDKYDNTIRKAIHFYRIMDKVQDPNLNVLERTWKHYRSLLTFAVFKDNSPFSLHFIMFIPAIIGQGTEEQKAYWLKRASNMEIIGTYAQTELGHGTFIRGLETKATYDPQTEEFVLHSPTLTAYKWWPGGLGHTANYCVVMAHLYIKDKSCGIQPFIVQIRDEKTHMPLPGIKVGEIGAKFGFNTVNNGFLGFENHRIARDRMLMKNSQVSKDGTFISSPNNKLTYGTMVYVRVVIVNSSANLIAKAVTVAIRYAAVRRQSQPKPDEKEPQILDYVTQQHKLFIAVATSHAFTLTAQWLWNLYKQVNSGLAAGNVDNLPELHALACCLKAVSSSDSATLVERCRLACGGHGYMHSSNLPQTYGLATAACTYEGENTVLMLQTARSLVKAWEQAEAGKPLPSTMAYFSENASLGKWDGSVDGIVKNFQRVSTGKLAAAIKSMKNYVKSGLSSADAWNRSSVQLVAASEAHSRATILATYSSEVRSKAAPLSAPVRLILNQLVELYAFYWSLEKLGDLLLYTSISESDVLDLQRNYENLLETIRPNAVGLVDAFDYGDEMLNSTLGAYDGRVYERLMEEALKSPLNAEPVHESFHKYLKPMMQGKL